MVALRAAGVHRVTVVARKWRAIRILNINSEIVGELDTVRGGQQDMVPNNY
jgi:hypothetical protein